MATKKTKSSPKSQGTTQTSRKVPVLGIVFGLVALLLVAAIVFSPQESLGTAGEYGEPAIAGSTLTVMERGITFDPDDPATGEVRAAQVFVATLGASSYTFVEATWTQSLPDWTGSHARALSFFGGVPQTIFHPLLYLGLEMIVLPVVIFWPAHLVLRRIFRR